MMFRFPPFKAPKRWVFIDPDTKYQYEAPTKEALVERVKAYRTQNRLPDITAISVVIENYVCNLPENKGACEEVKLNRGWQTYLKGGFTLLHNVFYGDSNIVSTELATERANQCKTCKFNIFPDKGPFAAWADAQAENATAGKSKLLDPKLREELGNCEACSCNMRAKVWYGGEISLTPVEQAKMKEVNCWQLKHLKS